MHMYINPVVVPGFLLVFVLKFCIIIACPKHNIPIHGIPGDEISQMQHGLLLHIVQESTDFSEGSFFSSVVSLSISSGILAIVCVD